MKSIRINSLFRETKKHSLHRTKNAIKLLHMRARNTKRQNNTKIKIFSTDRKVNLMLFVIQLQISQMTTTKY